VRNLVLYRDVAFAYILTEAPSLMPGERGSSAQEDEISHYVRNDKVGLGSTPVTAGYDRQGTMMHFNKLIWI
jgi:hypothetical protein